MTTVNDDDVLLMVNGDDVLLMVNGEDLLLRTGKRKFIQGLFLKIGVSFTVYLFLLRKMLNYRTFNINFYIES